MPTMQLLMPTMQLLHKNKRRTKTMNEQKGMCLFMMAMSIILFVTGGILKDYFLMSSAGMLLALASFHATQYEIDKLRKEMQKQCMHALSENSIDT